MKISIAMATYNGAKYLKEQLQSLADQTRRPDELIITDDCSTDDTEEIIRKFINSAPFRVEFYKNDKNLGYSGNFNSALMKTTGDLVFLSDQDDVWFPEKIEQMIRTSEKHKNFLLYMNDAELTDEKLNSLGLTTIGQVHSSGIPMQSFVMGCCCAIRRELLDLCLPIKDEYKGHDNWLVIFADGLSAKWIEEKSLQYYRRHDNNESQFLLSEQKKLNRYLVFKHRIKDILSFDSGKKKKTLAQYLILLEGIDDALLKSPEEYRESLEILREKTALFHNLQTFRVETRSKNIFKRFISVCKLYQNTCHCREMYRLKSALRDIVG